jgi:hypothetical protein
MDPQVVQVIWSSLIHESQILQSSSGNGVTKYFLALPF